MDEYEEPDNVVEIDAVSNSIFQWTVGIVIKLTICLFLLIFLGCEYKFLYCNDLIYAKSYEGVGSAYEERYTGVAYSGSVNPT